MLIEILLNVLMSFLQIFVFWLPDITSLNIDMFGFNYPIDDYLSTGIGYLVFLLGIFPPLVTIYHGFLFVLYWKSTLLFIRVLPFVGRFVR